MKKSLFLFLVLSAFTSLIHFFHLKGIIIISDSLLTALRYCCIAVLLIHGFQRKTVTGWILISLVAGFEFGYDFPIYSLNLKILSEIFLHLIKTIIAPLLFGTLVAGIAGHADLKQVGRMGLKSIIYFEVITTFALFIGLAAINISQAGKGIIMPQNSAAQELPKPQNAHDIILHIFPENIAKSIAEGQVLQIVVFSILFGIGLSMLNETKKKPILQFCEGLGEVMFKFTNIVMYFAPLAVFGAISFTVATYGINVFSNLIMLLLTLYLALAAFITLVLLPVMLIFGIPVRKFLDAVSEPVALAFATASSESALPIAMENMEAFGVSRKVVAFVLPTGYTFNLDGTTLYLSLASIFVAQVAGIQLSIGQQLIMMLTLLLTSKGVAGVPRASLVVLSATVASFGLPAGPILLILGIDALMDMARTSVNVLGNCLASVVVAIWEGELKVSKK